MKKREFIDGIRDLLDEYDGAKAVRGEIEGLSLERCGLDVISITDAKQFNEWIDDLVKTFNVKLDEKEASDKCCGGCESDEPKSSFVGNLIAEWNKLYEAETNEDYRAFIKRKMASLSSEL